MSDQAAPDSPFVTYPPDAARPGYNYRDYYPDSPDPEYVPIQGDEDFVESNSTNPEDGIEMSSEPNPDLSQTAAGQLSSSIYPSLLNLSILLILCASELYFRQLRLQPLNFSL